LGPALTEIRIEVFGVPDARLFCQQDLFGEQQFHPIISFFYLSVRHANDVDSGSNGDGLCTHYST